ncbi:hypothetical protein RJT34_24447 [Clitoria ternatea]|uniref:Uncharacterized protein n=1 Tax=Clitoria ternatea TaxID=43366 RepID=A0AAN9FQP1_CLITE
MMSQLCNIINMLHTFVLHKHLNQNALFMPLLVSGINYLSAASFPLRFLKTHIIETMPKTSEIVKSQDAKKVIRVPARRGQIKVKIMSEFVKMVKEAGRAMCCKEKVAAMSEESHSSLPHDSTHA